MSSLKCGRPEVEKTFLNAVKDHSEIRLQHILCRGLISEQSLTQNEITILEQDSIGCRHSSVGGQISAGVGKK